MTDFPDLGKHCSSSSCGQLDFLPFECKYCKKIFCLAHKDVTQHECVVDITKVNVMPLCPVCNRYIKIEMSVPTDKTIDEHISSKCQAHVFVEVDKSTAPRPAHKICSLKGCRNVENTDTVSCSKCRRKFCLKHRLPFDHACEPYLAEQRRQSGSSRSDAPSRISSLLQRIASNKDQRDKEQKERQARLATAQRRRDQPDSKDDGQASSTAAAGTAEYASGSNSNGNAKRNTINLEVALPSHSFDGSPLKSSSMTFLFDLKWTIGKCIDVVCKRSGLENHNNDPKAKRLVMLAPRTKVELPTDAPINLLAPEVSAGDTVTMAFV